MDDLVIHIDDNDVVKLAGYKFEALELVRDGSKSIVSKIVYEKKIFISFWFMALRNIP